MMGPPANDPAPAGAPAQAPSQATPGTPSLRARAASRWILLLAPLALLPLILAMTWREEADPDVHFHLVAGQLALERGAPIGENLFTHPHTGRAFVNHEWLFQLGFATLHRVFGDAAAGLIKALSILAAVTILAGLGARAGASWRAIGWLLLPILLVASGRFHARPEVVSIALLALAILLIDALVRPRATPVEGAAGDGGASNDGARGHRGAIAGLIALQIVWTNVHGFASLLPVILLIVGLVIGAASVLARRRAATDETRARASEETGAARRVLLVAGACLLATLCNPDGPRGALAPFELAQRAFASAETDDAEVPAVAVAIGGPGAAAATKLRREEAAIAATGPEWGRIAELASPLEAARYGHAASRLLALLAIGAAAAAVVLARRGRLRPHAVALAIAGALLGLSALRNAAFAAILLAPLLLAAVGRDDGDRDGGAKDDAATPPGDARPSLRPILAAIGLVVVSVVLARSSVAAQLGASASFRLAPSLAIGDALAYERAAAFIERERPDGGLFNNFGAGHWLSRRFAPAGGPLPFVSPHGDLYPPGHLSEYHAVVDGLVPIDRVVARHGVGVVLLDHRIEVSHALVADLATREDWALVHVDDRALLFVHTTGSARNEAIAAASRITPEALAAEPARWFDCDDETAGYGHGLLDALASAFVLPAATPRPVDRTHAANLLLLLGEVKAARREAETALRVAPDHVPARFILGNALRRLGQSEAAITELTRVAEAYPGALAPRLSLATIEIDRAGADERRLEIAERWLAEARSIAPDDAATRLNQMVIAARRGDVDAFDALEAEGPLPPRLRAVARVNRAKLLEGRNDLEGARASYREALAVRPGYAAALVPLGDFAYAAGDLAEAARLYGEAIATNPNHAQAHYNLGVVRYDQERWDDAVRLWEATLRLQPGHPQARRFLTKARKQARLAETLDGLPGTPIHRPPTGGDGR